MTSGNMIIENHQSEHSLLSPRRVFAHCLQKNNNILTTILMISSTINKRGILPNDMCRGFAREYYVTAVIQ